MPANQETQNLERAVSEIAPDKAATLAAKYSKVMDSIDNGLVNTDKKVADHSRAHLQELADNVINTAFTEGNEKVEDKQFKVHVLDVELTNIAQALGITLEKSEVSDITKSFEKLDSFFEALHINFPKNLYQSAYLNTLAFSKIDIKVLIKDLDDLKKFTGNSDYLKSYLYANQNKLLTAVGQFCNGKLDDSFASIVALKDELGVLHDPLIFNKRTGLNLSDDVIQTLMDGLSVNGGVSNEEVYQTLAQIRKENPDTFMNLHFNGADMIEFLASMVLNYRTGEKKFVNESLTLEAMASTVESKEADQIDIYSAQLVNVSKDFQKYKAAHPDELKNANILAFERKIALLQSNIRLSQFNQFRVKTQRYLAKNYAENPVKGTKFETVVADIFAKKTVDGLRAIAEKYKIDLPPDFSQLEVMEIDYKTANAELGLKEELDSLSPENKDLYNQFYTDFSAGKLETDAKKDVALHQIYEESQSLARLSDANEALLTRDRVDVYKIIQTYGSLSKVPGEQLGDAQAKVAAYLAVLKQGQILGGKLLGTYIDVNLLSPTETIGKDKTPVTEEITKLRDYLLEIGGSMEDMGQFLEIRNFKVPQEENIATSPLFMPILAREVRPFNEKCAEVSNKVVDSAHRLGHDVGDLQRLQNDPTFFEKQNIPPIRLLNSALASCDNLEADMLSARFSLNDTLNDLQIYKAKIIANELEITVKYPSLKDALLKSVDNAVAKVNFLLNDEKSPFSMQKLDQLTDEKTQLSKARDNNLEHVIRNIYALTAITAASVLGGIGALYLASESSSLFAVSFYGAVGGVAGERIGMLGTNAAEWTNFTSKQMWSPESLANDLFYSWGFSLLAVGAAGGLVRGANAENLFLRGGSKLILDKIGNLQGVLSPVRWVGMSEPQIAQSIVKQFGIKFATEYTETMAQTALQDVNPVLGFVAAVISSTQGIHLKLAEAGLNPHEVNVGIEGNDVVYKTGTAQEFVGQMETYFSEKGATNFKSEITEDGSVEMKVTGPDGNVTQLEVKPSKIGLEPNVEVQRATGIKFDQVTGKYSLTEASKALPAMTELTNNGFVLERTETGLRATKGDQAIEIEIDPGLQMEIEKNLTDVVNEVQELSGLLAESKQNSSRSLTARIQLALGTLGLSLLTSGCSFHEGLAAGLEIPLKLLDRAIPYILIFRVVLPKGFSGFIKGIKSFDFKGIISLDAFTGLPLLPRLVGQRKAPKNLGERLESTATQYEERPGKAPGDRAVQELGRKFQEALEKTDKKVRDGLTVLEYIEKFTGADRIELAKKVNRLEKLTKEIFDMFNNPATWDQVKFEANMEEVNKIIDSFKKMKGIDTKLANSLSIWKNVLGNYIVYKLFRLLILNGSSLASIITGSGDDTSKTTAPSTPAVGSPAEQEEKDKKQELDESVQALQNLGPSEPVPEKKNLLENKTNTAMEGKLTKMANKYGISEVKLLDNTSYDFDDLDKNSAKVEKAFTLLRKIGQNDPVARYVLTKMPIYILPTSSWRSWSKSEGFNASTMSAVIDSTESPEDMVIDVRDGIYKYAKFNNITKHSAIEELKKLDAQPAEAVPNDDVKAEVEKKAETGPKAEAEPKAKDNTVPSNDLDHNVKPATDYENL